MIATNEVDPNGFLMEAKQVNNNAFNHRAIDAEVKEAEEKETHGATNSASHNFYQTILFGF